MLRNSPLPSFTDIEVTNSFKTSPRPKLSQNESKKEHTWKAYSIARRLVPGTDTTPPIAHNHNPDDSNQSQTFHNTEHQASVTI